MEAATRGPEPASVAASAASADGADAGRRAADWRRPALAGLWAAALGYVALRFLGPPSSVESFGSWFEGLTIPFFLAAGAGALVGAALRSGRGAFGWRAVGAAWLVSAAAYLVFLVASVTRVAWIESAGELLYDSYYPCMVVGLLCLSATPAGLARRLRALLDVALVVGATLLLIWWFSARWAAPALLLRESGPLVTTVLGEVGVLGSAAWLLAVAGGRPDAALRLLGAGSVVATLADLATSQFVMGGEPGASRFADAGLVLSAALVASAGLVRPGAAARPQRLGVDLLGATLGHVPTLAVLSAIGLLVGETWRFGGTWPVVATTTGALMVLALLALALARHDLEDEAAERARQAERLAGAQRLATVGQMAGAVAHDFNNLAVAINGIAAELREAPPAEATVADLEALSRRASTLCRRLLDMARGAGEARLAPHELGASLSGLAPLLRRLVPSRVRVEVTPGAPAWSVVDQAQLELALVNLVVNARDAIPREGVVTLSAREEQVAAGDPLASRGVAPGRWAIVSVADGGIGMDAATLARVTEPFFTTKPPGQGTGLGLSLVADLTAAAGGRLVLDSAPGRGTTVRLVLPAHRPPG